jgi:hypothetical protein
MFQLKLEFTGSVNQPGNIINTSDHGYVACGTLIDNNIKHPFLVKISSYGQEEWRSVFEIPSLSSTTHFVLQTADGGFLMVGEVFITSQNSDILIIRTDSSGNILWNKSYGNALADYGNNLVQLPSGNFLICGESDLPNKTGMIIRIDNSGTILEENYFSILYGNSTVRGKLNGSNQIIITGSGINELYTDTSGIYTGESNIIFEDSSITEDVVITSNGRHVTIANTYTSSIEHYNRFLAIDSVGSSTPIYSNKYGNSVTTFKPKAILPSSNDGFVMAGAIYQAFGFPGWLYLIAADSSGNIVWDMGYDPNIYGFNIGGANNTPDGGYILNGSGYDGISKYELFIIKTDSIGNSGCNNAPSLYLSSNGSYSNTFPQSLIADTLQNIGISYPMASASMGTFNVLCYTSINDIPIKESLPLYPNPFYDRLELNAEHTASGNITLCFYNLWGELVLTSTSDNNVWSGPNLAFLLPGIYIVELRSSANILQRFKMVHINIY